MGRLEDQSKAIKQARVAENIGGICVIADRGHREVVGKIIAAIPGPKTRADARRLFQLWRNSPKHEFIVFGIFTNHTGISGAVAADWENARMFATSIKARLDELAEKVPGGYDSDWTLLVSDDQQRELNALLRE